MHLWDEIEKEIEVIKKKLHLDSMEERTWHCEPLMIVDAHKKIVFIGRAEVDVVPNAEDRAYMTMNEEVDGRNFCLMDAKVILSSTGSGLRGGSRSGVLCYGADRDGQFYSWYINGAVENFGRDVQKGLVDGWNGEGVQEPEPEEL